MSSPTDDVNSVVLRVLQDILRPSLLGQEEQSIGLDQSLVRDLRMDSDDFTFVFVPALERELGVQTMQEEWDRVDTVQDVIELFSKKVRRKT